MNDVISSNKFVLKYSPIVSAKTEILSGFNATINFVEEKNRFARIRYFIKSSRIQL